MNLPPEVSTDMSVATFDGLVAQAEEAAAGFDGPSLKQAMGALAAYMDGVVAQAPEDAQMLKHMRERLQRYQRLCDFLQQTLHGVLKGALQGGSSPCYKPRTSYSIAAPRGAQETHLAPLIRRYC